MTTPPTLTSFDGLMTLARRDGVDIRPTLLRVLTDLYVQTPTHSADEELQFVELASRLIDKVDDATRAAVRARLAIYPATPRVLVAKLGIASVAAKAHTAAPPVHPPAAAVSAPPETPAAPRAARTSGLAAYSPEAHSINDIFLTANSSQRRRILAELEDCPIAPAPRIDPGRAARAIARMEAAALARDRALLETELSATLIVPTLHAECIVEDAGGEMLVVAAKAMAMPKATFQRLLLFANDAIGHSVERVYALTRLYDELPERTALIMLAIWRGSMAHMARARHHVPVLYDDDKRAPRAAAPAPHASARPAQFQPASRNFGTRDRTPRG